MNKKKKKGYYKELDDPWVMFLVEKLLPFLDRVFWDMPGPLWATGVVTSRFFLRILFPIRLYIIPPIKKACKTYLSNEFNKFYRDGPWKYYFPIHDPYLWIDAQLRYSVYLYIIFIMSQCEGGWALLD